MTIHYDPWHTVTVTAIANAENIEDYDDCELVFTAEHPQPHENGCPNDCMTQQEIDHGGDDLPTEPGVYEIRAWGECWPATLAGDPAEFDGGIEVKRIEVAAR